jgi:hypothetical protein
MKCEREKRKIVAAIRNIIKAAKELAEAEAAYQESKSKQKEMGR